MFEHIKLEFHANLRRTLLSPNSISCSTSYVFWAEYFFYRKINEYEFKSNRAELKIFRLFTSLTISIPRPCNVAHVRGSGPERAHKSSSLMQCNIHTWQNSKEWELENCTNPERAPCLLEPTLYVFYLISNEAASQFYL